METPLTQVSQLMPLIEKIATDIATKIVEQKLNEAQFKPPKVPDHHHNGIDSIGLSLNALPNIFYTLSSVEGGVVASTTLGNQIVNQGPLSIGYGNFSSGTFKSKGGSFFTAPIPVIYGNGVGVDSQFNGGDAPPGTVIFFENGNTISGLWVNIDGTTWRGSAGLAFNRTV